ncbi:MAG: hypothetical protein M0Z40_04610 [Actinomycetota bacterium]|nr:hypothetical protein [Actinomycetota bacterium]
MSSATVMLMLAVFGACSVEAVEALTIVLASGTSRGWRSAMEGAGAALVVLAVIVGAVGVPLVRYVPIDTLRAVVGALLLVLGLSWLRKAILRASGHKAKHDEDAIYERTAASLRAEGGLRGRRDSVGFVVAFKGVFLEGMEVVLIVISLGASQHKLGDAAIAAAAAVVLVSAAGLAVSRQLSQVPENTIKTVVGIMLTSFGLFWLGEGAGVRWPGSDLAIPVLVGVFSAVAAGAIAVLKTQAPVPAGAPLPAVATPRPAQTETETETGASSETGASAEERLAP